MRKHEVRSLYTDVRSLFESAFPGEGGERLLEEELGKEGYYSLDEKRKLSDHWASIYGISSVAAGEILDEVDGHSREYIESWKEDFGEKAAEHTEFYNPSVNKSDKVDLSLFYAELSRLRGNGTEPGEYFESNPLLMRNRELEESLQEFMSELASSLE